MRVLIATPILYDESSPFNHLMHDILEGFCENGHDVTRIIAVEKNDDTSYKMGLDQIKYIPVKRKKRKKSNIFFRYLTDTFTSIKMSRMMSTIDADVLFEDVSYSSFWTVYTAKRKKMHIVSMIQDVWPDNAVQTKLIEENSFLYKYFETWQKYVYRQSDRLICISHDMMNFIGTKGVSKEKIDVIYNWGFDNGAICIPWEENKFVKKYNLPKNRFYAVYAGNIGRMQNVELIIEAAKLLSDYRDIHFLIVGDGVMRSSIQKLAQDCSNITLLPFQPKELATSIYSMANVNIVPLVSGGLKTAMPSKIGVCLSCGKQIIACVDDNTYFGDLLYKYQSGVTCSPNDPTDLADSILSMSMETHNINFELFNMLFKKKNGVEKYSEIIKLVGER